MDSVPNTCFIQRKQDSGDKEKKQGTKKRDSGDACASVGGKKVQKKEEKFGPSRTIAKWWVLICLSGG